MRATRVLRTSLGALARNRLRTFFMMLGSFVGVAALTVILAIGRGTEREVVGRMERMLGGSTMMIRAGGHRSVGIAQASMPMTMKLEDLRALEQEVASVERTDPMIMTPAREVIHGNRARSVPVTGHSENAELVWNRSVTRGAYFTSAEVASAARVALVGPVVARELFAGADPIGEQIRIGAVPFEVIGVLQPAGIDPHGIDLDDMIIIPVTTMMRRVLNIDYILSAKIALTPGTDMDLAVLEVGDVLRRRHGIGPDQMDDFAIFTPVQAQQAVASTTRVFTLFLPLVAGVSILIGALVVANLMLVNVSERRAEIGLRKAIGARARDIRLQFMIEAAAVTSLGGVAALAFGVVVLQILARVRGTPAAMPWSVALLGLAAAVAVGVVSGVVPARRAAALDPVQTLR